VLYQPDLDRYGFLETIRQYLLDRSEEDVPVSATAHRHLSYFADLAKTAESELKGPGQTVWLTRLDFEHDNFRAGLSWSRRKGGDVDLGLRVAGNLHRFWIGRGFLKEGREQLALTLAVSTERTAGRATALNVGGILAYRQADYT